MPASSRSNNWKKNSPSPDEPLGRCFSLDDGCYTRIERSIDMTASGEIKRKSKASVLVLVFSFVLSVSCSGNGQTLTQQRAPRSEVRHIGGAEVKLVVQGSLVDPQQQPEVYWHDPEWSIDLVAPESADQAPRISIRSHLGNTSLAKLPEYYEQISEILRGPEDKAIVLEDNHLAESDFSIIDLKSGQLMNNVGVAFTEVSPNRRFVFFEDVRPLVADTAKDESRYRLYDALKSPRGNTCGYRRNDPTHKYLDPDMRGFQVYPRNPGHTTCDSVDEDDDNSGSNFVWADDSSKIVFADLKNNVMSLVLVMMPLNTKDPPRTLLYPLTGAENVCAGAKYCDSIVKSLTWNSDAVNVAFVQVNPAGPPIAKSLTIPLSKFVPIGK
jgi:hypothetical protein